MAQDWQYRHERDKVMPLNVTRLGVHALVACVFLAGIVLTAVTPTISAWACPANTREVTHHVTAESSSQAGAQIHGKLTKVTDCEPIAGAKHINKSASVQHCDDKCHIKRNEDYNKALASWSDRYLGCLKGGSTSNVSAARFHAGCKAKAGVMPKAPKIPHGLDRINFPPPPPDPRVLALEASATLTIPDATPKVGPPPGINKWHMVAVGYPLWLWTPKAGPITKSVTLAGATLTMTARRTATTFNMGDGHTVTCAATTPWSKAVEPGAASPTCGYAYQVAVKTKEHPKGAYTVTATDHWTVSWRATGSATGAGTIPLQASDSMRLPVGELQSVITGTH